VCIIAFSRPEDMPYFPNWMELAVSLGIVAGATLVFIFFVENLKVYSGAHAEESEGVSLDATSNVCSPAAMRNLMPDSLSAPRRYSLAAVLAAAVSVAFLPADVWSGTPLRATPVFATRTVDGWRQSPGDPTGARLSLAEPGSAAPADAEPLRLTIIDGNRDGRLVLFPHGRHIAELGGGESCRKCHHQNMPFDTNTSCFECHRDMYTTTDIFDHAFHVSKLDGNDGCGDCHPDPSNVKNRDTTRACVECHEGMNVAGSLVSPPEDHTPGFAAGYMDAMHRLCIACHERMVAANPRKYGPEFAECAHCHRAADDVQFHQMQPYEISRAER